MKKEIYIMGVLLLLGVVGWIALSNPQEEAAIEKEAGAFNDLVIPDNWTRSGSTFYDESERKIAELSPGLVDLIDGQTCESLTFSEVEEWHGDKVISRTTFDVKNRTVYLQVAEVPAESLTGLILWQPHRFCVESEDGSQAMRVTFYQRLNEPSNLELFKRIFSTVIRSDVNATDFAKANTAEQTNFKTFQNDAYRYIFVYPEATFNSIPNSVTGCEACGDVALSPDVALSLYKAEENDWQNLWIGSHTREEVTDIFGQYSDLKELAEQVYQINKESSVTKLENKGFAGTMAYTFAFSGKFENGLGAILSIGDQTQRVIYSENLQGDLVILRFFPQDKLIQDVLETFRFF